VTPSGDERRYVRALERAWSKVLGRPAVVSPREFEAIDAWRRRGIPLTVVLEVLAAFGKRHSGKAPRGLTALSRAVDEAWSVVAAGRASPGVPDAQPPRSEALRAWEEALGRCGEGAPLHRLLSRLLAEAVQGEAGLTLDAALDASLPGAVPEELLARATEQTESALEEFRRRMTGEEFRKTFDRALADRLRGTLELPRLALTRPGPPRQMPLPPLE
jgi:hypothetical protein